MVSVVYFTLRGGTNCARETSRKMYYAHGEVDRRRICQLEAHVSVFDGGS